MGNLNAAWFPQTAPMELHAVLVVAGSWPMTPGHHWNLMTAKVADLFAQESREDAQRAMKMSEEELPELALIARNQLSKDWPQALMFSDTMQAALNKISWDQEKPIPPSEMMDVIEALRNQSLMELIESL
jgi:hypothetical protein